MKLPSVFKCRHCGSAFAHHCYCISGKHSWVIFMDVCPNCCTWWRKYCGIHKSLLVNFNKNKKGHYAYHK